MIQDNPIELFGKWYENVSSKEKTAVVLATCNKNALPSARVVLLKEYSTEGFVFFTNINSRKGQELKENPRAALVFYWNELGTQVRVEGNVKLLDEEKTDKYFASRERESQISAWCSKQSHVMESLQDFEQDINLMREKFHDKKIQRPSFWVGFCIKAEVIEFWQAGEHRRHIRLRYTAIQKNKWKVEQLYP
ncbi:pyridoxamine 5'-phosphate oxidase [Wolbachia endosymbiont of Pentidionis agamae]|uniref:pyridoxamine 5'-phosphate oxidase n=1 Tax=Wolbachia endosymbiont of Pentidionis agamae TaxID=3110435 RepID=UPI002FD70F29